ncbi:MAG: endonuclease domain-containing protein [Roseiarcus sp.]
MRDQKGAEMVSEPHRFARSLRKASTSAEDILWAQLRGSRFHGAKFTRQVPVDRYVVDFCCHAARLVVEIDGAQHGWQSPYDDGRTTTLESAGFHVVRFTNEEVRDDLEGVLERLESELRLPSG